MQTPLSDQTGPPPRGLSHAYKLTVILVLLALAPLLLRGVVGALRSNSNDPRQWLPRGFDETKKYNWLQQHFGNDEITVVSWPGCTLEDPRAEQLARACLDNPDGLFQRAITGQRMVRDLARRRVPHSEAIKRLQGVLVGPDGDTTCVVLTISKRGEADRVAAVEEIRRVAEQACGIPPGDLHLGGPTVDAATIDVESQNLLLELAAVAGAVALAITWLRLRSLRLAGMILAVSVYSTAVALSALYYTGGHMNLVMTMLPPLIFVLTVSAAIHLVNYYRDALTEVDPHAAPLRALHDGWRPCLLASATTAVGLLSLAVSDTVPVRMFGIYSSVGMCGSLLVVIVMLPVTLSFWPEQPAVAVPGDPADDQPGRMDRYVDWVCRHDRTIVVVGVLLMAGTGIGLTMLRSTVKLQYRFGAHSRILQDYRWLESNLGPLVPLELVIHFDGSGDQSVLEQLQEVHKLEQQVQRIPDVGATLSATDFIPDVGGGGSVRFITNRRLVLNNIDIIQQKMREYGFLSRGDDDSELLWRITVRASALSDIDYGRFVSALRENIDPAVAKMKGVRVTYTGVIPLIYKAQRELLNDLVESFLLAFAVIAVVMMLVLRGVRAGVVAMIPNIFPAVLIFGVMGWTSIWIEIGSIMTASAAMGIAVDDTFHLLTWYRRGLRKHSRYDALQFSMRRCAGAMIHTSLVCSLALLVFSYSSFMPIRRFSWLMAALLMAALAGDVVLLPALLSSPLGKVLKPSQDK